VAPRRILRDVQPFGVAQIFNLPFRRIISCRTPARQDALELGDILPITNRRNGRVQLCPTAPRSGIAKAVECHYAPFPQVRESILKGGVETTDGRRAAEPQPKERGSVSRSTAATKDARDFSKAWFHGELLRVTDPRSEEFAQRAKAFTDSSTDEHRSEGVVERKKITSEVNRSRRKNLCRSVSICGFPSFLEFQLPDLG
jgi:hypothetical protein